jgi:hypothetical protein
VAKGVNILRRDEKTVNGSRHFTIFRVAPSAPIRAGAVHGGGKAPYMDLIDLGR